LCGWRSGVLLEFSLFFKFFAGDAVPTLLLTLVDITFLPHPLEKFNYCLMIRSSGAAEAVVLDVQLLPKRNKPSCNFITVGLGRSPYSVPR